MTTPAGWYDDGSGRQRWWDGTQWTEHFAPIAEPATPADADEHVAGDAPVTSDTTTDLGQAASSDDSVPATSDAAAAAETAASIESVAATETPSWNAPASEPAAPSAESPDAAHAEEVTAPESAASWSAPAAGTPVDDQPTPGFTAPGATAPTTPLDGAVPPYVNAAPAYPGSAPTYPAAGAPTYPGAAAAPGYPGAAPGYPAAGAYAPGGQAYGAAGGYPQGYPTAPAAPSGPSILGIVGLGIAALGTILSCIPLTFGFGWLLLAAGFIVSLISLFLKGKKWPGISGLILSVVGTIIAVVVAIVFVTSSFAQVVRDLPSSPPSSDSDGGDTGPTEVVEGEVGAPVTIEQMAGTSEVTINSARWTTDDGSGIDSTNGGYVVLDVTFTGVSGTSYVNPFYVAIETADGAEGSYDYYVDGIVAEELAAGDTVEGTMTFDVAQSETYTVIFTDELLEEVARVSITPTAG